MVSKGLPIIWDVQARQSLREIFNYIREASKSVRTAAYVRDTIIEKVGQIAFMPQKHQNEPSMAEVEGDFRYLVIWSYKIIFEVSPEQITILDIFHTRRDPGKLNRLNQ